MDSPEISKECVSRVLRALDVFSGLKGRLKTKYGWQIVTNASLKIYEIVWQMKLIPPASEETPLKVFFNAELPGAFITSLNQYIKTYRLNYKFDWVASSLWPTDIGMYDDCKTRKGILGDQYGLYERNRNRWLMGPPPAPSGDLANLDSIHELVARVKEKVGEVDLYTSDVGVDVGDQYDRQEEITSQLNFGQILTGLLCLRKGGNLVTKQFTITLNINITLISLLASLFNELYITKPRTSRPLNSEVYLVGKDYLGISLELKEKLERRLKEKWDENYVLTGEKQNKSAYSTYSASFASIARAGSQIHINQQILHLKKAEKCYTKYGKSVRVLTKRVGPFTEIEQDTWLDQNKVKKLSYRERVPQTSRNYNSNGGARSRKKRSRKKGSRKNYPRHNRDTKVWDHEHWRS